MFLDLGSEKQLTFRMEKCFAFIWHKVVIHPHSLFVCAPLSQKQLPDKISAKPVGIPSIRSDTCASFNNFWTTSLGGRVFGVLGKRATPIKACVEVKMIINIDQMGQTRPESTQTILVEQIKLGIREATRPYACGSFPFHSI